MSIAVITYHFGYLQHRSKTLATEEHTRAVGLVDDDIPVLERIGDSPDQALSSLGGRVDRDETERSFGAGHSEYW